MNDEEGKRQGETVTPPPAEAIASTVLVERLKEVGIPPDKLPKLQGYVEAWKGRGLTDGEAWSVVISWEQWVQARLAFKVAVTIGLGALLVAICSLLVSIQSLLVNIHF